MGGAKTNRYMCAGYKVSCQYIFVKENWHDLTKNWGGERKVSVLRSVFLAWMSENDGTTDRMEMFEEGGGMLCQVMGCEQTWKYLVLRW